MTVPVSQGLVNTKCFDWQEEKWGRKDKVINFRLFECGSNLEVRHELRSSSLVTVESPGGKESCVW